MNLAHTAISFFWPRAFFIIKTNWCDRIENISESKDTNDVKYRRLYKDWSIQHYCISNSINENFSSNSTRSIWYGLVVNLLYILLLSKWSLDFRKHWYCIPLCPPACSGVLIQLMNAPAGHVTCRSFDVYRYSWKKDGRVLDTGSGQSKYMIESPGGSIVIKSPSQQDDGVYQCFARNEFGTAVTIKTRIQRAGIYVYYKVN